MPVAVQLYLDESVTGPEVCIISRRAGVHSAHKLSTLCLVIVQVEAVAALAFHHVTQAGDKLVRRLWRRLHLLRNRKKKTQKQKNGNVFVNPINF